MNSIVLLALLLILNGDKEKSVLDGSYYNNHGDEIIIKKSSFFYVHHDRYGHLEWADTLAICKLDIIESGWAEINSCEEDIIASRKSMSIEQYEDSSSKDSLSIEVFINCKEKVHAHLDVNLNDYHKSFNIEDGRGICYIPHSPQKNLRLEYLHLSPICPSYNLIDLKYNGRALISFVLNVEPKNNCIRINIPKVDDMLFERFIINGEYIRIEKNRIKWREQTYERKIDRISGQTK